MLICIITIFQRVLPLIQCFMWDRLYAQKLIKLLLLSTTFPQAILIWRKLQVGRENIGAKEPRGNQHLLPKESAIYNITQGRGGYINLMFCWWEGDKNYAECAKCWSSNAYIQPWPLAYKRLLNKPYVNEVFSRGQNLPYN